MKGITLLSFEYFQNLKLGKINPLYGNLVAVIKAVFSTLIIYLRWSGFAKIVNGPKSQIILARKLHHRCLTDLKCARGH